MAGLGGAIQAAQAPSFIVLYKKETITGSFWVLSRVWKQSPEHLVSLLIAKQTELPRGC